MEGPLVKIRLSRWLQYSRPLTLDASMPRRHDPLVLWCSTTRSSVKSIEAKYAHRRIQRTNQSYDGLNTTILRWTLKNVRESWCRFNCFPLLSLLHYSRSNRAGITLILSLQVWLLTVVNQLIHSWCEYERKRMSHLQPLLIWFSQSPGHWHTVDLGPGWSLRGCACYWWQSVPRKLATPVN